MLIIGNNDTIEGAIEGVIDLGEEELIEEEDQEEEESLDHRIIREVSEKIDDEELRCLVERVLTPLLKIEENNRMDLKWTGILKNLLNIPEEQIQIIVDVYMEWKIEKFSQFHDEFHQLIQTVKNRVDDAHKSYVWRILAVWEDVEPLIEEGKQGVDDIEVISLIADSVPRDSIQAIMRAYDEVRGII